MYERRKKVVGRPEKCAQNEHIFAKRTAEKIASLTGVSQATVRRDAEFAKPLTEAKSRRNNFASALLFCKTVRGDSLPGGNPPPPGRLVHKSVHTSQACRNGLNPGDNGRGGMIAFAN